MSVRDLSQAAAERLSSLLDQALDLAPGERAAWLAELSTRDPDTGAQVKALLASMAEADADRLLETRDLLENRDLLNRHLGTAVAAPASLEGRLFGPYRVLRLLGQGGMGSVWLAERADGLFSRQVALKLVHQSLMGGAGLSERFARERAILAGLDHPRIARLLDAGVAEDGQPYLAIEYVEGTPLTVYCDARRLPLRGRLDLVVQVLSAVQHAHRNLVVHRDLKPSNILVTREGQVRLLDFGIAKLLTEGAARETELTQQGGRALTPEYASPEQIAGEPVTTASDVYSLGVLLYELMCGNRPYQLKRDSRGALEEAILTIDPAKPSQSAISDDIATARSTTAKKLRQALAGDLDTIVLKALKKNPSERYATADAFMQDLQRYGAGEVVLARPDSALYRARKFVWRNKFAAASAMAVFVALAAGLGVALWQADKAREQARIATAVQTFLEDIFRANSSLQPDPVKARQTPARILLDTGAAKISDSLKDVPEAKVSVLATLADLYDDLGLTEQTVALQRQRVALAKSTYGAWHAKVADALVDLAGALHESSAVNEREAVLREAKAILDRQGDQRSRLRGELDLRLAEFYQSTDLTKTIDFAQRAVNIFRAYPASFSLVEVLTMEGIAYDARKEYREAITSLVEAGNIAKALPAGARRTEPIIYAYLAEAQFNLDDFSGAEASYRQAWRAARSLRGEEHEDTIQTQWRLGTFLANTGRAEEGLALLREAKDLVIRTKGAGDIFHLPRVLSNYGSALIQYGQIETGVAELSTAIELRRRQGSGTRLLAQMLESEAPGLIALGRYSQAAALLDEASGIREKVGDKPRSAQLTANALVRADLALATGHVAAAEAAIAALAPDAEGERPSAAAIAAIARSKVSLAAGRKTEALESAGSARKVLESSQARDYLKAQEAQALLAEGKALLADDRSTEALPPLERAVGLMSALHDRERSPALAEADVALADCHAELHRADSARLLLARAKAIEATHAELGQGYREALRDLARKLRVQE